MSVLVTGGAGFVGLNLVDALLARGDAVVLFDGGAPPAAAQRAFAARGARLSVERGDVLDGAALDGVFARHAVQRVLHCAAVTSGPEREAREPALIARVNVGGTIAVLEAARRAGAHRIVVASSGAVYGEASYRLPRFDETVPPEPVTLYGITKFAAERACMRLRELWRIDVACARLGTVIGPWERDTGVRDNFGTHSQLARLAQRGGEAVLPAHEVRRDWIYARDVAGGLLALLDAGRLEHAVYNLGSGLDWSGCVAAWGEALQAAFPGFRCRAAAAGERPNVWYTDRDRGLMDVGRLARDTGFRPRYGPREAYADYVDWLRAHPGFWP